MTTLSFARIALALSIAFVECATATSLGWLELSIQQISGRPAGCLSEQDKESIAVKTVSVRKSSDAVAAPPGGWPKSQRPWMIKLKPGASPLILHPGECILFGESIPGYAQDGERYPLEMGETYGFAIRRGDVGGRWIPDFYSGAFCVARDSSGETVYLPYVHHDNGTITYPVCARYAGLPAAPDGFDPPRPASSYPIQP